ncbi:hypothetical protein [Salinarimonas sp.]|uniref:hypothetical protein n=1 Tax=Salinarimonas sp. TaxID=2766526 RepID=UPI0032D9A4C5
MLERRSPAILAAIVAAMLAMSAVALVRLGPGAPIAMHFGLDGEPTWRAPAAIGLLVLPLGVVLIAIVGRRPSRGLSPAANAAILVLVALALLGGHAVVVLSALGVELDPVRIGSALSGSVLIGVVAARRWSGGGAGVGVDAALALAGVALLGFAAST